jgi:hypothetical protein
MTVQTLNTLLPQRDGWRKAALAIRDAKIPRSKAEVLVTNALPLGVRPRPDYRSKILALAYPHNPSEFDAAVRSKVRVNDLLTLARGQASFRDGQFVKLGTDARGGSNRKEATKKLRDSLGAAFISAKNEGFDSMRCVLTAMSVLKKICQSSKRRKKLTSQRDA